MTVKRLILITALLIAVSAITIREASASFHFRCLKPTDLGITTILSTKPVSGPIKDLLGNCNLLKDVETVRYFTKKTFDQGTLIGLGDGCIRWVFYLNLQDLNRLLMSKSCPR